MNSDGPIVDEVRRRRLEISAEYDHDLRKYADHLREIQDKLADRVVNQLTVVRRKPKDDRDGGCQPPTDNAS